MKTSHVSLHSVTVVVNSVSNFSLPSCSDEGSPSICTGGCFFVCRRSCFPQILGTKLLNTYDTSQTIFFIFISDQSVSRVLILFSSCYRWQLNVRGNTEWDWNSLLASGKPWTFHGRSILFKPSWKVKGWSLQPEIPSWVLVVLVVCFPVFHGC